MKNLILAFIVGTLLSSCYSTQTITDNSGRIIGTEKIANPYFVAFVQGASEGLVESTLNYMLGNNGFYYNSYDYYGNPVYSNNYYTGNLYQYSNNLGYTYCNRNCTYAGCGHQHRYENSYNTRVVQRQQYCRKYRQNNRYYYKCNIRGHNHYKRDSPYDYMSGRSRYNTNRVTNVYYNNVYRTKSIVRKRRVHNHYRGCGH